MVHYLSYSEINVQRRKVRKNDIFKKYILWYFFISNYYSHLYRLFWTNDFTDVNCFFHGDWKVAVYLESEIEKLAKGGVD